MENAILKFQEGSQEAFRLLVERCGPRLYRMAVWLTHDPASAQDMVQEVFVKAWRRRAQLRSPMQLTGWLYAILRNTHQDWMRRPWRCEIPADAAECLGRSTLHFVPSPEEQVTRHDEANAIRAALQTLSVIDQQILALRYGSDLSVTEIARTLGMRPGAVATRIHRALRKLRVRLPDPHSD